MRLFRHFFVLAALPLAALALAIERVVSFAFGLFAPDNPRVLTAGPSLQLTIGGTALARDVQQGLRHEAGVPRYAAQRNR